MFHRDPPSVTVLWDKANSIIHAVSAPLYLQEKSKSHVTREFGKQGAGKRGRWKSVVAPPHFLLTFLVYLKDNFYLQIV